MRAVIQRVRRADVSVAGEIVGAIEQGLVVLVGFTDADDEHTVRWVAEKITSLRLFPDEAGKMNRSLAEVDGEVMVVSQFTLYGDVRKGRRPSFVRAADPEPAEALYHQFIEALRHTGTAVATGQFGAEMDVSLINWGPVTLVVEK